MTRGALAGIGLLLSNALEKDQRRSAGLAPLAVARDDGSHHAIA